MNKKVKGVIMVISVLVISLSFVTAYDDSTEAATSTGNLDITSVSYVADTTNNCWIFSITVGGSFPDSSSAVISAGGQVTSGNTISPGGTYYIGNPPGGGYLSGGTYAILVQIAGLELYANASYTVLGSVTLTDVSLDAGDSVSIPTMFNPVNPSNPGMIWSSSDEDIAIVDENGEVTGISQGVVTITAVSEENSTIYDTCQVTVYNYIVTATAGVGGSISPSGVVKVVSGDSITFSITASSGYKISDVLLDGASQGAVTQIELSNVDASHTIYATFQSLGTCKITATAGEGGSISPSGMVTVTTGGSKSFTITPDEGCVVYDVLVNGSSVGSVEHYTFSNVTENQTISAIFGCVITATAGDDGSISPSGSVIVPYDGSQTFTMVSDSGYAVYDVLVNGSSVGSMETYTFSNVTESQTISVTFGHTITATAGEGGSISPSGVVRLIDGSSVSFTITPNSGCVVYDVLVNGSSIGSVEHYTFSNVTENQTISVTFGCVITATAGEGGSISPESVTVVYGESQVFTVSASNGYKISDVKVDGVSVGAVTTYTFSDVNNTHTISVTFKDDNATPWIWILVIAILIIIVIVVAIYLKYMKKP